MKEEGTVDGALSSVRKGKKTIVMVSCLLSTNVFVLTIWFIEVGKFK